MFWKLKNLKKIWEFGENIWKLHFSETTMSIENEIKKLNVSKR